MHNFDANVADCCVNSADCAPDFAEGPFVDDPMLRIDELASDFAEGDCSAAAGRCPASRCLQSA